MKSVISNFDWSETKVPLVIFIPNYGRGDFIRRLMGQFTTKANRKDWLVIVGNDGIHDDFSDLYPHNVRYFTLNRDNPQVPRNGCFIRNYFIKRCLAENIFQKDPETELVPNNGYDWIKQYTLLRNIFIRPWMNRDLEADKAFLPQQASVSYRMHWGFLCPTWSLIAMRGYWEKLSKYGYEDTDLWERLTLCHLSSNLDVNLSVQHHWHDVDPSVYREVNEMGAIFAHRDRTQCVRNGEDWGEG